MPTRNPRINVVLEKPLYDSVYSLANKDKVSLSTKVRDLIQDAIEFYEDRALAKFAEEREKSFEKSKALSHEQFLKHFKKAG